ncbi:hypothetical protein [Rheinheimera sp. EpRS3]|uniref:hypothetical protein n=1 Tax=Rheinheimera sp. EpRS3 TaxID=1712383 RepID=UPI00074817F3|nr:hypothetical protein [Rheinheimera sp. EpRS3]KUM52172.1 hypothetical protein AR688_02370 [Rheinheimera sp. EpRS3]
MHRLLIIGLFLSAVAVAALYPYAIYIRAAEPQPSDMQSEQPLLHFWADKKHANWFSVGSLYLLQHETYQVSGRLFSITHATARPDEIKLGFYLETAELPIVTEHQIFSISERHTAE